jgi:hypothetical protein
MSAKCTLPCRKPCLKALLLCLAMAITAVSAFGQTVRPLIQEYGNPGKGRVEYVNDALTPLNVVLEAKSFTVSETGQLSYRALDSKIHLKLSATSFRIPPQQSYFVYYEAKADEVPAWFVIYAVFSGFPFRSQQGMNVRLELPHTVYLLPKQSVEKQDLSVIKAEFDSANKKVLLEIENNGGLFGRVLETDVLSSRKKQEAPGFPVFPHSRRRIEAAWNSEEPPEKVQFQFANFRIDQQVSRAP